MVEEGTGDAFASARTMVARKRTVRGEGEGAKIAIRNLRRDANEGVKKLVKEKLASEDDLKRCEADIQKVTDRHIALIDQLVAGKEQDIMAV